MQDPSAPASKKRIPVAQQPRALAEARLRNAGLRITAARVKILSALYSANCALSHQDIRSVVAIDRVTLYRVLASLIEAGLAHMITGNDRVSRYSVTTAATAAHDEAAGTHSGDGRPGRNRHGHFQCTLCSRMFCLEHDRKSGLLSDVFLQSVSGARNAAPEPLKKILQKTLGTGFKSHDIELIVKGWCADCAALTTPAKNHLQPCH